MTLRLWRDESGMALGLAVILVVVIGVMAAGFLALVRNDLEASISSNRGQQAFALADAGAQAGVSRLRSDANPEHYDASAAENSEWAHVPPAGAARGKVLELDEGSATVTVRYLIPAILPSHLRRENRAPELVPTGATDYPEKDFFTVVSEATSGDTRRKVEVIVCTVTSGDTRRVEPWGWREVYE